MTTATVNGTRTDPFHNPDRIPLEKLDLVIEKDGISRKVPALSKEWTEQRRFLRYEPPCIYDRSGAEIIGAKDRWLELVTYITKDFEWLLQLPFYKFWSNVIYERSIVESLVSFLQESPTFYNLDTLPNDETMRDLLDRLARDVLVVFARLVISKENKEEFMSDAEHGAFLYDEFLFTVPMMLDICQLYGRENAKVVEKIISTVIKIQPAYNEDIGKTVEFLTQVFKNIDRSFDDRATSVGGGAVPLASLAPVDRVIRLDNLEDLVVHLLDVSSNISIFLDVYPSACEHLRNDEFVNEIIHVYGNTIPKIYKHLDRLAVSDDTVIKYAELKHFVDVTRIEMLKIFRTIVYRNIEIIIDQPNPSKVSGATGQIEQFVNYLDRVVSEREFMLDYHAIYPIDDDLDIVASISNDIDPVKLNFIKRSVLTEFVGGNKNLQPQPTNNPSTSATTDTSVSNSVIVNNNVNNVTPKSDVTVRTKVELDSLISNVKDVFNNLGDGFVERCLEHYNHNVAAVINAVIENSLPEHLKNIDKELPHIPPDSTEPSAAMDRVLGAERLNVFDNDEFDVMTRDTIDTTRVHRGKKKDKYKNLGQLLDDKSFRRDVGNIYEKFSMIQDDYEDEYDDTYDSHDVGLIGVDEPVEIDGRALTIPRVLRVNEIREPEADVDDDEDANSIVSNRGQTSRENFVQDPAEMRARAEQRRMSKRGSRGHYGGGGPQPDLVGKPKGQGNDKSVLANRDKKNTNKASRGNHNRRTGAEYKRRQGMVPS